MMLVGIGIITTLLSVVVAFWRAVEERRVRWALYALRDELRWTAISNEEVRNNPLFEQLDESITVDCRRLAELSIWPLLPFFFSHELRAKIRRRKQKLLDALSAPKSAPLAVFYERSVDLLERHIIIRHLGLVLLAISTGVGIFAVLFLKRRIAEYWVSQPTSHERFALA